MAQCYNNPTDALGLCLAFCVTDKVLVLGAIGNFIIICIYVCRERERETFMCVCLLFICFCSKSSDMDECL